MERKQEKPKVDGKCHFQVVGFFFQEKRGNMKKIATKHFLDKHEIQKNISKVNYLKRKQNKTSNLLI